MKSIDKFLKTVAKLRSKDGCPWDRVQTHKTLKRYLIEETYETIDAIEKNDHKAIKEELGDILLQIVLHAQIAKENDEFTFNDIVNHINKKMISRHPHVFGNTKVKNVSEVLKNWEILKSKEKPNEVHAFKRIPNSLPALLKAWKVSKKASKEGFDWKKEADLWKTFEEELKEFKSAQKKTDKVEELGDLLFMLVNIARWYKIDPEDTLNQGTKKFIKRYDKVKKLTKNDFKNISDKKLNQLWEKVKKEEY